MSDKKYAESVRSGEAGGYAACARCGKLCRVAGPGSAAARLLRLASTAAGYCATCCTHEFLLSIETLRDGILRNGPAMLRKPAIQETFAQLCRVGNADADPQDIDWNWMVDHWDLPFPELRRGKRHNAESEALT